MNQKEKLVVTNLQTTPTAMPMFRRGPWGHFLVSASACLLTISIVGSAVFLVTKIYKRYHDNQLIHNFLASLENRTAQEINDNIVQLEGSPKLVEKMLPELTRTLHSARSEEQLCAVIKLAQPFLKHKRVRDALFELRADGRESVAAAAITSLTTIDPPDQAAEILGRCVDDIPAGVLGPAATDRVFAGLFQLGTPGLDEALPRLMKVDVDRRVWLAGYVNSVGGPHRQAWLKALLADKDEKVKAAAEKALSSNMNPPVESQPLAKN